ncbi:MAG TPA: MBL fold metallo-hydrolase [bacterium]|nr:MBL fold metallo-hydrolase [bacterium]
MINLAFHGAAQTVTGSRYLVRAGRETLLIDCGMFQGLKELRLRNWEPPDFDLAGLDAIVLTHAHTDHTAYLPRLHRLGFRGKVYCSAATAKLTEIILLDAAELQEEDAQYLNKKGASKHKPAQPLFDVSDAKAVIKLLRPVKMNAEHRLSPHFAFTLRPVGHILGACSVRLAIRDGNRARVIYFSGDVGRFDSPLLPDPLPPEPADYLVMESTYGDRLHGDHDSAEQLAELVDRIVANRGVLLIPAFAVGRAQQVVYLLHRLQDEKRIPRIPIHVDSPMALDATEIFYQFPELHRLDVAHHGGDGGMFSRNITYHRTRDESKAINALGGPRVIISASGMLTGGRVLHHLMQRMGHPENIIALAGFQAAGTRGRDLVEGRRVLRFHGREHEVRAQVAEIDGLSGHADYAELMRWLKPLATAPERVFVTHGEPIPAAAMVRRLGDERQFAAVAPAMGDTFEL